jgi:CHAD domain-containing protein
MPRSVPAELQSMVWAVTFGAPLLPIARIRTERTVRRLTDASGQVVAEVADDRVTAQRLLPTDGPGDAAGAATSWREIEVELPGGSNDLGDLLDVRLRKNGLREASAASKLAHLLGAKAASPQVGSGKKKKLTTTSRSGEVLLDHIRTQVAQVQAQDLPVRLDAPDAVHKMRVATRRLRSALSTFKRLCEPDVVRPLRGELKWLAGELGAARDAEVMRDRVREAVASEASDAAVRGGADAALSQLTETYRTAHDRVLAELDSDRYHRILEVLHALVEEPPLRKPAKRRAGTVLPRLVARGYDRVSGIVEDAQSRPAGAERDELFHDARKAAKQARYAGETVAPVFGKDATAYAQAMENVQEVLGEHQDSVLTRERLRDLAVHAPSTEVAFLYGRLHAQEEVRGQESHERFDAAWKDAGRKRLHRWMQ